MGAENEKSEGFPEIVEIDAPGHQSVILIKNQVLMPHDTPEEIRDELLDLISDAS